jgi:NAD(P)-dependent dehydrogenase (short-subunit alcohol dehydrogenase family)
VNLCGVFAFILLAIIGQMLVSQFQEGKADIAWKGSNGFGWVTTAEEVSEGVDMTGKVALVTGANSEKGLGFENARVFALRGAHVVVSARSKAKAEEAIQQIKALLPSGREYKMSPLACDLGSLKSVDKAVQDFRAMKLKLHYLIANAGIMALPTRTASVDGYEMQVAVNHLGHFHLITQLTDILLASAPARVVLVSSLAHEDATSPRAFLESDNLEMPYDPWGTYGDSKLSNVIFAKELNERYSSKGVTAFSLHPGIIDTNLGRSMTLSAMLVFFQKST